MNPDSQRALRNAFLSDVGVKEMVRRLGGTRAVAQAAGVSIRTVQRWGHDDRVPKSAGGGNFNNMTSPRTPQGRRVRTNPRKYNKIKQQGGRLRLSGTIQTVSGAVPDERGRSIDYDFNAEELGDVMDAWITHGPAGAHQALNRLLTNSYLSGEGNAAGAFMEITEIDELDIR